LARGRIEPIPTHAQCPQRRGLWLVLRRTVVIVAVAFLFLWLMYGFRVGPLEWEGRQGGPVRVGSWVLTVPAPDHWEGMLQQMSSPAIRMMFLAGEARTGGWWWYFPFAFLIKNPVPLLLIWLGAIVVSVWRRPLSLADYLFLLAFPVVYAAVAVHSRVNIGYRHLLPIHPFLYVLAAQWALVLPAYQSTDLPTTGVPIYQPTSLPIHQLARDGRTTWPSFIAPVLGLLLGVWYVVGTLSVFPHYLAYFNELVGGPRNGYRYLVDSNLDWGQGFKALRETLDSLDVRSPLKMGHTWYVGPESYGVRYEPLPPLPGAPVVFSPRFDPPPGTYVLGATLLQRPRGDLEQYEWFRHYPAVAQPGYALFVYRVEPHRPPATWVAQCVEPAPPLSDELIAGEFHSQPLRRVTFDCTRSWVYPEDGRTSGWYALHGGILEDGSFLTGSGAQHLEQARQAYVHHQDDGMAPVFELYEFRPGMRALTATLAVRIAPAGMSPLQVVAERPLVTAPLHLEGPLDFLGYRIVTSAVRSEARRSVGVPSADARLGSAVRSKARKSAEVPSAGALTVETWWRVADTGPDRGRSATSGVDGMRPVSIMAHLVDGDGRAIGVADGLGVPMESWREGDVLVQVHRFSLTEDEGGDCWLRTGVYWLDTLERHRVTEPAMSEPGGGDHVLVEVHVR